MKTRVMPLFSLALIVVALVFLGAGFFGGERTCYTQVDNSKVEQIEPDKGIIKNSDFSIRHHGFLLKGQRDFKLKLLDTPLAVYRKRPAYGFGAFLGSIKADTAHCST